MDKQAIISVESLGKSYRITHKGERQRYVALRDVLADRMRGLFRFGGRRSIEDPAAEDFWALKNVSFEINQGDVVGIIGRNGAGKSTLLKILSRITEPSEGRVRIRGRVASLLEVGTGFHPELTGRENIFLNGAILGMTRAEIKKKFDEIVAFAEVEKFLDTPVKRYSSGMYVRLAFAVAAHLEPEILVVDEVLAVGDAEFQKKCLGKMHDVATNEGRTVLFVSHNLGTIATLCTKGIYFKQGKIKYIGRADSAISDYVNDGREDDGEKTWSDMAKAPGSEKVRFRAVRIVCDGKNTANTPISSEVTVEVDFAVLQPGAKVNVSIHLLDQFGTTILATANMKSACLHVDPLSEKTFPQGTFRSRCVFPANFLNEGRYQISAFIVSNTTFIEASVLNVVSFHVHETGEMRKEYSGGWIGMIRPRLDWHTEQVGA